MTTKRQQLAPAMDLLCIVAFIALGRDRHGLAEGISWFFTVFWPLAVGWAVGALVSRLYTRPAGMWVRLAVTIVVALLVGGVLRGAFTERVSFSIFTAVAFGFLTLTTYTWRLVWGLFERRRRTLPA